MKPQSLETSKFFTPFLSLLHYNERNKYGYYVTIISTDKIKYLFLQVKFLVIFLLTQICHNTSLSKKL